jgi:hypothetical protein
VGPPCDGSGFFEYQPAAALDLIYERAFFCALPPVRRQDIVRRWIELLPPGALLAGYFSLMTVLMRVRKVRRFPYQIMSGKN